MFYADLSNNHLIWHWIWIIYLFLSTMEVW
jgi:hypothetical protein